MLNVNLKEKQITENLAELYNTDYYTWAMTNAELLKEGKLDKIDYINLAEEVKDLGKSEYYRLVSFFANLLSHLYKWDNQPDLRTKSWGNTIKNSLKQAKKTIEDNPGLKSKANKAYLEAWAEAANIIHKDTQGNIYIPEDCPYTYKEAIKKVSDITNTNFVK